MSTVTDKDAVGLNPSRQWLRRSNVFRNSPAAQTSTSETATRRSRVFFETPARLRPTRPFASQRIEGRDSRRTELVKRSAVAIVTAP
jgi:hypothetical protein